MDNYDLPINIWEAMAKYDLPMNIWEAMTNIIIFYLPYCYVRKTHRNIVSWCFCQTEGNCMLRYELIQKEMVECSQTSKSKEQKHKNYLKHNIYSLLQ